MAGIVACIDVDPYGEYLEIAEAVSCSYAEIPRASNAHICFE